MKNFRFKKISRATLLAAGAGIAFTTGALTFAQSAPSAIGVIYVDSNALYTESKAGQAVASQIGALKKSMEDDLGKKAEKLQLEQKQLEGQQAMLSQDAWQAKVKDAQEKQMGLQREADDKQRQLQSAIQSARAKIWQAAGPVLDDLLKEKQASIVLERMVVLRGTTDIDVTATAVDRLNQKLPTLKIDVPVVAPAAGTKPAAPAQPAH
jgi:Skp family chaperone for outer membrane proteins